MVSAIFKKELRSYFTSPLGYVFMIIFLFAQGYLTFEPGRGSFFLLRQADMQAFMGYIPFLFAFLIPAVGMRMWAEERKSGTIELLLTLPIKTKQAIIGKFLAGWAFMGIGLLGTLPFVGTLIFLGSPDIGVVIVSYIGCLLLAGALLAVSGFFSALTKSQVTAFILSVVACLIFIMASSPPVLNFVDFIAPQYVVNLFESMGLLSHFDMIGKGIIRFGDIWYFTVLIIGWLIATYNILEHKKAN